MHIFKCCPYPSKHRLLNAGSKPQLKSQKPSDGLAGLCIQQFNFIQEKIKLQDEQLWILVYWDVKL
jgi:hypothetical protein